MKKLILFSVGMLAFTSEGVNAQTLFTTDNDFSQWTANAGDTTSADSLWSADTGTINGLGNTSAAGGSGTSGSLSITWASGVGTFNDIANAPGEAGNAAFLQAIDPGATAGTATVAGSGNIYLDYSLPPTVSGTYFQLGLLLQYPGDGYYQTFFSSSTADLGFADNNGQEVYQATIPYTISAGTLVGQGFGMALMFNSNYSPSSPFHVDDITVSAEPVPEPGVVTLMSAGLAGLMFLRRRLI